MLCPKCGAENAEGSQFCGQCGATFSPIPQPVQSNVSAQQPVFNQQTNVQQPAYNQQPVQQPAYNQQPVQQPVYGQQQGVQQPVFGQQPMNQMPAYGQPVVAPKKSKKVPIIIAACATAVVAAVLIVLFVVILPNTGVNGKLRHKWSVSQNGIEMIYDFKNNTASVSGISIPFSWSVKDDTHLDMTVSMLGQSQTQTFTYSLSDDGKSLTLTEDGSYSSQTFTRVD
ncbi:MAG: zinc-ribbon domain-containing protein [Oscillospiraceae bacterium]|nr:zinc-ribbon domain-containing protein [Oscillospiraceae bacterium]